MLVSRLQMYMLVVLGTTIAKSIYGNGQKVTILY